MSDTIATPTPTHAHFAALAAAFESGDRESLVRTLDEMAAESLILAERPPSGGLWSLSLNMHEWFYGVARDLRAEVAR